MSLKLKAAAVGVVLLMVFAALGGVSAYEQVPEGYAGISQRERSRITRRT